MTFLMKNKYFFYIIKGFSKFKSLEETKNVKKRIDIHLDVYYVQESRKIYDVIMNITAFVWLDDNTQWSKRQAFY